VLKARPESSPRRCLVKKLVYLFAFLLVGVASAAPSGVPTTETSATLEGLDCGSTYRLEIRRYTAGEELSPTAVSVDAETKSCPDTPPPSNTPPASGTPPPPVTQDLAASGTPPPPVTQDPAAAAPSETSMPVSSSAVTGALVVARCAVPDVRRRTVTKARAMLSARGCRLGRVTRAYSPNVAKGRITGQGRRPGARLPHGTRVNVAVSRGRPK
jgi:PASTA domain